MGVSALMLKYAREHWCTMDYAAEMALAERPATDLEVNHAISTPLPDPQGQS